MHFSAISDHLGFSPDRSIQPSTVVRLRQAKVVMSFRFKSFTMAVVLHLGPPDLLRASSICLKRKGVNQLGYFVALLGRMAFRPCGFQVFSLNLSLTDLAGQLSAATVPPWSSAG